VVGVGADRVLAVWQAEGVVKCAGSSMFLKRQYGEGYSLIMAKDAGCSADTVTAFVKSHVPGAKLQSSVGTELSYLLPREASRPLPVQPNIARSANTTALSSPTPEPIQPK
jgi:hypothetical protein